MTVAWNDAQRGDLGEVQPAEPIRVREDVDRDDPRSPDRQGDDRERVSVRLPRDAAGGPVDEDARRRGGELAEGQRLPRDGLGAVDQGPEARTRVAAVGPQDDVWVEDREEALEVALTRGSQERVHDGPLAIQVDVRHGRTLDAATGPARELPRRRRCPTDDRPDLVERHREHVVQDEGDAFGRRQRVQDDEQGEPDRVAQQRLLLGIEAGLGAHDRVRDVGLEGRLAARPARSQHVQADPSDDRRQPRPQVVDVGRVGAAQADPGFLDGVVRLGHGAEHPEGDAAQVRAVVLEPFGEPILVVHRSHSCGWFGNGLTREPAST